MGRGLHREDLQPRCFSLALAAARTADRHGGAGDVPAGGPIIPAHPRSLAGCVHLQLGENDADLQPAGFIHRRPAHLRGPAPEAGWVDSWLAAGGRQPAVLAEQPV